MAKPDTIGNKIAPPRFLAFMGVLIVGVPVAGEAAGQLAPGGDGWFRRRGLRVPRFVHPACSARARRGRSVSMRGPNDANRIGLLVVTGIVMTVLMIAITAEAVGRTPQPFTKVLIIVTLALAWLFATRSTRCTMRTLSTCTRTPAASAAIPAHTHPVYWDFVYFSFACGMAFATSDVEVTETHMRKIVTIHCLAAFALQHRCARLHHQPARVELGGNVDLRRSSDLAPCGDQASPDDQRRSGERVDRHALMKDQPAERRRPEEGAISVTAR